MITAFAHVMSDYLNTSELTESRAFIRSFVKEIGVRPGRTTIYYAIPTPEDSPIGGGDSAAVWECAANGSNSLSETWRVNAASVKRVFPKWWSEGDSNP